MKGWLDFKIPWFETFCSDVRLPEWIKYAVYCLLLHSRQTSQGLQQVSLSSMSLILTYLRIVAKFCDDFYADLVQWPWTDYLVAKLHLQRHVIKCIPWFELEWMVLKALDFQLLPLLGQFCTEYLELLASVHLHSL